MAAVGFKLGLAGTSRADSSAEPRQGSAYSHEPRQAVFQLRKLDLQLALTGDRAACEDIQYQHGAVDDTDVGFVLNVSYLRRGKLAVEYKKLRAKGAAKLLHLGEFSLAYYGGRLVGFALLKNSCKLLRSGGLCKL